jgi:hypothetical protein
MFKDVIVMDDEKILREGKFPLENIYYSVYQIFIKHGFLSEAGNDWSAKPMRFYGVNGHGDIQAAMLVVCELRNAPWFLEYVKEWIAYENVSHASCDGFAEIDALAASNRSQRAARECFG